MTNYFMALFFQRSFAGLVTWRELESFGFKEGRDAQHKRELHFHMG